MHQVVVLLGGNEGNVQEIFQQCITEINSAGFELKTSSNIYQSAAWGYESDHAYLNQALVFTTQLAPMPVLNILLEVEKKLGRTRTMASGYTDRPIDIDIMFYDDLIINSKELTIPHPRLHHRKFCLVPLNELMPELVHPLLNQSMAELLLNCNDPSEVKPL